MGDIATIVKLCVVEHLPELSEEDSRADVLQRSKISVNTFLAPESVFYSLEQLPFHSVANQLFFPLICCPLLRR